jgi:hypothetical protein
MTRLLEIACDTQAAARAGCCRVASQSRVDHRGDAKDGNAAAIER